MALLPKPKKNLPTPKTYTMPWTLPHLGQAKSVGILAPMQVALR